ncbi:hypothetical protein AK812_SmicGene25180 [Symbiodinium microadriaticum]|uniref:Uncharacterized protein n=1 Tax=Symbiodinium microadriaticum TaxID=2951 RepID=A0A1Q9DCV0_SYMMI|nr:hypothetical protein AK812_SmicGene25180 [Symbiodinium microadriaticum]
MSSVCFIDVAAFRSGQVFHLVAQRRSLQPETDGQLEEKVAWDLVMGDICLVVINDTARLMTRDFSNRLIDPWKSGSRETSRLSPVSKVLVFAGKKEFLAKSYATPRARLGDPQANLAKLNTAVQFFSETAKVVFPSSLWPWPGLEFTYSLHCSSFLGIPYKDPDYVALAHSNLNVDNAYFWRDEEHLGHYVDTFIQSWLRPGQADVLSHLVLRYPAFMFWYHTSGGPALDRDRLLLMDRRDPRIDENIGGKSTLRWIQDVWVKQFLGGVQDVWSDAGDDSEEEEGSEEEEEQKDEDRKMAEDGAEELWAAFSVEDFPDGRPPDMGPEDEKLDGWLRYEPTNLVDVRKRYFKAVGLRWKGTRHEGMESSLKHPIGVDQEAHPVPSQSRDPVQQLHQTQVPSSSPNNPFLHSLLRTREKISYRDCTRGTKKRQTRAPSL